MSHHLSPSPAPQVHVGDALPCVSNLTKETSMQHVDDSDEGADQKLQELHDDVASVANTILYDQEPFETFQHKIVELAKEQFHRNAREIQIHQMKGGSFNRVVGVTIPSKPKRFGLYWFLCRCLGAHKKRSEAKFDSYVVRIPRTEYEGEDAAKEMIGDMEREVALVKTVGSRLPLPIPKVFNYDLTTTNLFERPYMIQTRLPGQNLRLHLWGNLNMQQKQCAAKHITNLATVIASVEGPAGDISSENLSRPSNSPICVETFHTLGYDDQASSKPTLTCKPIDHLLERCEQWRACERSNGICFEEIWDGFEAISKALEKRGFLHGPCVLVHGDLMPYNLLAEIRSQTEVEITGVIDWDSAIIAPEFMAYRAPFWLWAPEDIDTAKEDEEIMANFEPVTAEGRNLKQVFLENASEKYKLFAFAPEAMLARRMFRMLKEGLHQDWDIAEAKSVIREWNELHPEYGVQYPDSDAEFLSKAGLDDSG